MGAGGVGAGMNLDGRAAIVTGGAGGLGSATVRHLVDVGMRVVVFDWNGDAAAELANGAAKAAILGMTLPMARDLAPLGVRVCAIAPGTMGTPAMLGVKDELKAKLVENIVFPHRMGRPEEFALLVESIARNPYLNGESIRLDGALRFPPK